MLLSCQTSGFSIHYARLGNLFHLVYHLYSWQIHVSSSSSADRSMLIASTTGSFNAGNQSPRDPALPLPVTNDDWFAMQGFVRQSSCVRDPSFF